MKNEVIRIDSNSDQSQFNEFNVPNSTGDCELKEDSHF